MDNYCLTCQSPINLTRSGSPYCQTCRSCSACGDLGATHISTDDEWPGHWCPKCKVRWRRYGSPNTVIQPKGVSVEDRFQQHIGEQDPVTGCIPWTGPFDSKGYGRFRVSTNRRGVRAPRIALWLATGVEPAGMHSLHSCPGGDNPACVNPEHLRWGTNAENMNDRFERTGYATKLSDDSVRAIRASGDTALALGRRYGISASYAGMIRRGKARTRVTD